MTSSFRRCLRFVLSFVLTLTVEAASNYSTPYVFSTFAGFSSAGSNDGPGQIARFYAPRGIAVDDAGNVYVADTMNHTIRKITPGGMVTTLAGTAGIWTAGVQHTNFDGTGAAAMFANPEGIAVDSTGTVFVADKLHSTIRKITPDRVVTTWAGAPREGGFADGTGSAARFFIPGGMAADAAGNIYVAEWVNNIIRKITPAGVVTTLAGLAENPGAVDGTGSEARFFQPYGVAADRAGNVYVVDSFAGTVRKITPSGVVTTIAGQPMQQGSADGTGAAARFRYPTGIAVDADGNLYVADSGNSTIRRVTPSGVVTTLAGMAQSPGSADGTGTAARFRHPSALALDKVGNLYVADVGDNTIRKITPAGAVSTLAGLGLDYGTGSNDGGPTTARFNSLASMAVKASGEVYVADTLNSTIRKISADGVTTTFAGKAGLAGGDDGTGDAARFAAPYGVAVDQQGTVFISDPGNDTIRRITPAGVVTTLAGDASAGPGLTDGTGREARFNYPAGLAVGPAGTVYVADRDNSVIRGISPSGATLVVAGGPGIPGNTDGPRDAARFSKPTAIAADRLGNLYVADTGNHTIRKISPAGEVTTLAGSPLLSGSADGAGSAARFNAPDAIAVDLAGSIYVADTGNHTIRLITPAGVVSTLGGLAEAGGYADGAGEQSRFSSPLGVAVDPQGTLYVTSGTTVRKGQAATASLITDQPRSQAVTTGENVTFTVTASGTPTPTYQWYLGITPITGATHSTLSLSNVRSADAGNYTVVVTNPMGSVTSDAATLTVTTPPANPASPPPGSGGSGTGGGGGAPSLWFLAALVAASAVRCARRNRFAA